MKRIVVGAVLAAALALVLIRLLPYANAQEPGGAAGSARAQILDETVVQRGELTVTVSGTGPVKPSREVALRFEVTGPVLDILVEEGQAVSAGDVLARIDLGDLEQSLEDAEVALEMQRVAYEALIAPPREADIAAAEAAVNAARAAAAAASQGADAEAIEIARLQTEVARNQLWQRQLERDDMMELPPWFRGQNGGAQSNEILTNSGLTQAEIQVSINEQNYLALVNQGPDRAALGSAAAQLAQAQVALDRLLDGATEIELRQAEIDLQLAELALAQAQTTLEKGVLRAPFDGVIARNNLVLGELPPATVPAMLLLDTSQYYVELAIDETDIVDVQVGQAVELTLDALDTDSLTGTVTRVGVVPVGAGQLVTYPVRVTLDATTAPVRSGMNATATIITSHLENVLTVPNRFIRIDRATQRAYVTVVNQEGTFREVEIELGLRNDIESEVISGLSEGAHVVLLPRETFNPFGGQG